MHSNKFVWQTLKFLSILSKGHPCHPRFHHVNAGQEMRNLKQITKLNERYRHFLTGLGLLWLISEFTGRIEVLNARVRRSKWITLLNYIFFMKHVRALPWLQITMWVLKQQRPWIFLIEINPTSCFGLGFFLITLREVNHDDPTLFSGWLKITSTHDSLTTVNCHYCLQLFQS